MGSQSLIKSFTRHDDYSISNYGRKKTTGK